ncbi:MAG: MBL fold metallo-hydrolase [Saprospiraceae bacterium]|nr:MBL fold metallo-hydrolase [Saprospiraceae bacterium]
MNIHRIVCNPFYENCYLVWDQGPECLIIDPGMISGQERKEMQDSLKRYGLTPSRLLLTHAHIDHVFGCQWVFDTFGLLPELHRSELAVYEAAPQVSEMYGLGKLRLPEHPHLLDETAIIVLGDLAFELLFVPGHSPGSIAYHEKIKRIIFSGDVLFEQGIGRTDLPGGNYTQLVQSLRTKMFTLPEETVVYSGHGNPTNIGAEKDMDL